MLHSAFSIVWGQGNTWPTCQLLCILMYPSKSRTKAHAWLRILESRACPFLFLFLSLSSLLFVHVFIPFPSSRYYIIIIIKSHRCSMGIYACPNAVNRTHASARTKSLRAYKGISCLLAPKNIAKLINIFVNMKWRREERDKNLSVMQAIN